MRCDVPSLPCSIRRTTDAAFLNTVANHPDVRPWLGGTGVLDLAPVVAMDGTVAVQAAHGGFVAESQAYGRYEVHSLFLPERPGGETLAAMRDGLQLMFAATEAQELVTKVPGNNRAAAALAKRAGFQCVFRSEIAWGDERLEADFLSLSIDRWALASALASHLGHWFHESIDVAKAAHVVSLPEHSPEDAAHLSMVGATVLMLQAGNVRKAVTFYNRWARWTGYTPILVVSEDPVVFDIQDVVIAVDADGMEIVSCR